MASKKKLLQAAAGSAGGAGLDVDECFSCHLYDGTGADLTINNGIDLSTEGGLVWFKHRSESRQHALVDTERGISSGYLDSATTDAQSSNNTQTPKTYNTDGFTIGSGSGVANRQNDPYVSWTFRKAPRFFQCLTYTGNTVGSSAQTISHGLGSTPGFIIVKRYSTADNWIVWHRSITNGFAALNDTGAWITSNYTSFISSVGSTSFSVGESLNTNGESFVAYVFAHNDSGDGEFGPDSDQDIIKCGSYTGNGSTTGPVIDLGFEPQWLLVKCSSDSGSGFVLMDNMRGFTADGAIQRLETYSSNGEAARTYIGPTSTGFQPKTTDVTVNGSSRTYIYIAIRRGPLAAPEDATKVFAPIAYTTTDGSWQDRILQSNFTTDLAINGYRNISDGGTHTFVDRLRGYGTILRSHQTSAESDRSGDYHPWPQTGQSVTSNEWSKYNSGNGLDYYNYQWKRAPSYFDVVAYTGNITSGHTINHNLGVVPEMMWVKRRTSTDAWKVYYSTLGNTKYLHLNENIAAATDSSIWNDTSPTASIFTLGDSNDVNGNGESYIAYLFATVAGVSKVGSYTGNDGSTNVDCGFSNGARFILIKKTNGSGNWLVFDSTRGTGTGNTPYLYLNTTDAEDASGARDIIDPYSSGFTVNANIGGVNDNGDTFLFYAIA